MPDVPIPTVKTIDEFSEEKVKNSVCPSCNNCLRLTHSTEYCLFQYCRVCNFLFVTDKED